MDSSELAKILEKHQIWLSSHGKEGERASLSGAALNDPPLSAVLKGANLQRAVLDGVAFGNSDLTDTNLRGAELRRADFGTATLRRTNLRESDLQNANLHEAQSLLSTQLAGADVAGAKLPSAIADFEVLKTIAEATSNAQKLFIAILAGCVYSWLTIGTTKDAALIPNSASSPLPVIGTALPIVGFYLVAPVILLALYIYFHLNMQRLWEALADLPAVFPDGRSLDKRADPWLLNGLVGAHFVRLKSDRPALSGLQECLSILLAWWLVPLTLLVFWGHFLKRHDLLGTGIQVTLLIASISFGWMSYRLARATLRGTQRVPYRWKKTLKNAGTYRRIVGAVAMWIIFALVSLGGIFGRPVYTTWNGNPGVPEMLSLVGFLPFADFDDADVSTKPSDWTGKPDEYPLVKGAKLADADLRNAYAPFAFLANARLERANLSHAYLLDANLEGATMWQTNLEEAELPGADLKRADLSGANLQRATLERADLKDAHLWSTDLKGVDLTRTSGLTKNQLADAITDEHTLVPSDLPP